MIIYYFICVLLFFGVLQIYLYFTVWGVALSYIFIFCCSQPAAGGPTDTYEEVVSNAHSSV